MAIRSLGDRQEQAQASIFHIFKNPMFPRFSAIFGCLSALKGVLLVLGSHLGQKPDLAKVPLPPTLRR